MKIFPDMTGTNCGPCESMGRAAEALLVTYVLGRPHYLCVQCDVRVRDVLNSWGPETRIQDFEGGYYW